MSDTRIELADIPFNAAGAPIVAAGSDTVPARYGRLPLHAIPFNEAGRPIFAVEGGGGSGDASAEYAAVLVDGYDWDALNVTTHGEYTVPAAAFVRFVKGSTVTSFADVAAGSQLDIYDYGSGASNPPSVRYCRAVIISKTATEMTIRPIVIDNPISSSDEFLVFRRRGYISTKSYHVQYQNEFGQAWESGDSYSMPGVNSIEFNGVQLQFAEGQTTAPHTLKFALMIFNQNWEMQQCFILGTLEVGQGTPSSANFGNRSFELSQEIRNAIDAAKTNNLMPMLEVWFDTDPDPWETATYQFKIAMTVDFKFVTETSGTAFAGVFRQEGDQLIIQNKFNNEVLRITLPGNTSINQAGWFSNIVGLPVGYQPGGTWEITGFESTFSTQVNKNYQGVKTGDLVRGKDFWAVVKSNQQNTAGNVTELFILSRDAAVLPALPSDAAIKTYTLKAVSGAVQWTEEAIS